MNESKPVQNILFCLVILFLLSTCKKDALPMGDMDPGVALTFDDASLDKWVNLLPLFQKYNVRATFFICTGCTDSPLDRSKILALSDAGNEIGSHSVHHLHLSQYITDHSIHDYYTNEILPSVQYFDSLNIPVTSFAYPYGDQNSQSDNFLSKYFQKIRGICLLDPSENGAFLIHKNKILVNGSYIDRASPYKLKDFQNAILEAKSHHAVLILIGHTPDSESTYDWSFPVSLLDSICRYTVQQNMKFYRMQDL